MSPLSNWNNSPSATATEHDGTRPGQRLSRLGYSVSEPVVERPTQQPVSDYYQKPWEDARYTRNIFTRPHTPRYAPYTYVRDDLSMPHRGMTRSVPVHQLTPPDWTSFESHFDTFLAHIRNNATELWTRMQTQVGHETELLRQTYEGLLAEEKVVGEEALRNAVAAANSQRDNALRDLERLKIANDKYKAEVRQENLRYYREKKGILKENSQLEDEKTRLKQKCEAQEKTVSSLVQEWNIARALRLQLSDKTQRLEKQVQEMRKRIVMFEAECRTRELENLTQGQLHEPEIPSSSSRSIAAERAIRNQKRKTLITKKRKTT